MKKNPNPREQFRAFIAFTDPLNIFVGASRNRFATRLGIFTSPGFGKGVRSGLAKRPLKILYYLQEKLRSGLLSVACSISLSGMGNQHSVSGPDESAGKNTQNKPTGLCCLLCRNYMPGFMFMETADTPINMLILIRGFCL